MRQKAYVALLAAAAFSLVACGGHAGPRPGQLTLGMVTDIGGLGDKSFNDSAHAGLLRAAANLGAYTQVLQSRSAADYQPNLSALSNQKYGMIYAIGFLMSKDLDQVAKQNPNQRYAIIDAVVDDPNVISVTFQEQDGSFLAGALAAMVSKTHHVAFLGGQDIPLLRKFEAGFTAGAHEIDPNTKVDVKYVNSFDDVAAGKELANVLFQSGADIVYAAAGKAGLGAIDAARARPGAYIIGVDSDQDGLAPGKILTSMVKHVDIAVYDIAQDIKSGKLPSGHLVLGLKDHAIGLTDFQYTKALIGLERVRRINSLEQAIISGRIVVPTTREALATFVPVKM
ncbi:MAG TPA: BMP family ABC transporter substrate-binding protein [Verrucomicrobiae bacterium]|jgi:basic membrane protein A|nr:BMP family ABC transporter substrate-binding protein [Verrucomicrobiae bacterium]